MSESPEKSGPRAAEGQGTPGAPPVVPALPAVPTVAAVPVVAASKAQSGLPVVAAGSGTGPGVESAGTPSAGAAGAAGSAGVTPATTPAPTLDAGLTASDSRGVEDSRDSVEPEGPDGDERLWAAAVWVMTALALFLPPIPPFVVPILIRRLRKRASEFVSAHAGASLRFGWLLTVLQGLYGLFVLLTVLSLHAGWRAAIFPALAVYFSASAGVVVWMGLVGHNAWKGRRNGPSELRKLVFYR